MKNYEAGFYSYENNRNKEREDFNAAIENLKQPSTPENPISDKIYDALKCYEIDDNIKNNPAFKRIIKQYVVRGAESLNSVYVNENATQTNLEAGTLSFRGISPIVRNEINSFHRGEYSDYNFRVVNENNNKGKLIISNTHEYLESSNGVISCDSMCNETTIYIGQQGLLFVSTFMGTRYNSYENGAEPSMYIGGGYAEQRVVYNQDGEMIRNELKNYEPHPSAINKTGSLDKFERLVAEKVPEGIRQSIRMADAGGARNYQKTHL